MLIKWMHLGYSGNYLPQKTLVVFIGCKLAQNLKCALASHRFSYGLRRNINTFSILKPK